jgi:hypothetical protein
VLEPKVRPEDPEYAMEKWEDLDEATRKDADGLDLLPRYSTMQPADATNAAEAWDMYHNTAGTERLREAAIYRNTETGEYIVVQGGRQSAGVGFRQSPAGGGTTQRWKEILNAESDVGHWELQAHSHPIDPNTGVVSPHARYASGATGDMNVVYAEALRSGKSRVSYIDYLTENGPQRTTFGYEVGSPEPFWIDAGAGPERFDSIHSYHDYMMKNFGSDLGTIPDYYGPRPSSAALPEGAAVPAAPPVEGAAPPVEGAALPEAAQAGGSAAVEEVAGASRAEPTVGDLHRRAFEAEARAEELGRGDWAARARALRENFTELEGLANSPEDIRALAGDELAQLEALEAEIPARPPEFEEGAHSRLSQDGGLYATEGTLVEPADGKMSEASHGLKKHAPDADWRWLRNKVRSRETKVAAKFADRAVMEEVTGEAITANQSKIEAWLAGNPPAGDNLGLPRYDAGRGNLGEGFYRDPVTDEVEPIPADRPLTEVQVILKATGNPAPGRQYIIQTVYPALP